MDMQTLSYCLASYDVVHGPQVWFTVSSSGKHYKSKYAYFSPELVTFQNVSAAFLFKSIDIFCCCSRLFSGLLEALTWLLRACFPRRAAGVAVSSSPHPKALTGFQAAISLVQQFQLHSEQTSTTQTAWTVSAGLHSKEVEV